MKSLHRQTRLVRCIRNTGHADSLTRSKVYVALPDEVGRKLGLIRVKDESGEDYLFPESYFVPVDIKTGLRKLGVTSRSTAGRKRGVLR